MDPFLGSEALTCGRLTRHTLRSNFVAIHPDVYVPRAVALSAETRARASWLWSRRRGVVAGQSAAALHGSRWVDGRAPAELIYDYRRPPKAIRTWSDRLDEDEIQTLADIRMTTPARTALGIACRYPLGSAVAALDALCRATHLKIADVELLVDRYTGHRGIRRARRALSMVDGGAESPRETWLRLLLIRSGFPAPRTRSRSTTNTAN